MTLASPLRRGPGRPPGKTQRNVIRDRLLVAFYLDGHTLVACGEKFGVTTMRAHQIVAKHERLHGKQLLRHDPGRPRAAWPPELATA